MKVRILDLFSGIGGFSLAAEWAFGDDLEILGFCDNDRYAKEEIQKAYKDVPFYDDVRDIDGKDFKEIEIICGGFPCQDISIAGRGEGLSGARSGLWAEMLRIISEARPQFALVENVPALTFRGLGTVLADISEIGYDAEWQVISAKDVGANHLRKRIWIVAYPRNGSNRTKGRAKRKKNSLPQVDRKTGCSRVLSGTSKDTEVLADTRQQREGSTEIGSGGKRNHSSQEEIGTEKGNRPSDRSKNVADSNNAGRRKQSRGISVRQKLSASKCSSKNVSDPDKSGHTAQECGDKRKGKKKSQARKDRPQPESGRQSIAADPNTTGQQDRTEKYRGEQTQTRQGKCGSSRCSAVPERIPTALDRVAFARCEDETGQIYLRRSSWWRSEPDLGDLVDGFSAETLAQIGDRDYWGDTGIPQKSIDDFVAKGEWRHWKIPRITTGCKRRVSKLKALGNAIVPECAYVVFQRIGEMLNE